MKFRFFFFFLFLILISCFEKPAVPVPSKNQEGEKDYALGESWHQKNNDSSYYFFNRAFNQFSLKTDSINSAKSLNYCAIIQLEECDYFGSEETSINALKFLKEGRDNSYLLSIYNTIALTRNNLKDYKSALSWYEKAFNISEDSLEKISLKNNIAVAYAKNKNHEKAISIFKNLLKDKNINKNISTKSKIIDNLAFTKFLQNKNYNAESEFLYALKIRKEGKDLWGQNASHAHLSDFFVEKNHEKALFHAQKMYGIAKTLKSPDDQLEALQKLITLESSEKSKFYFEQYQKLDDSLQTARAKARNQFALIRYETEKEKAENAQNKIKILNRNIALLLSLLAIIIGLFWHRKRKNRLEKEKEIEVKNTQLKYSKKIHDVVANGLYQTMIDVENQPELNKENLLNKLEKMYEESRDIAHEDISENIEKEFSTRLFEMISSYSSAEQKVLVIGNEQNLWNGISQNTQSEVFYSLRELMINMKKHSKATLVSVKFEKKEYFLKIKYTDNGIGINELELKKASGIKNTENRIETIGGDIIFEKNLVKGLQVNISIPIH